MKLLHFADVHFDQQNADRALASLAVVEKTGRREKVDVFLLAGDLFNRGITNSSAARLPDLIAAMKRLLLIAPVFAVSGTPTHDVAGCYAPLQELGLQLLAPGGSVTFETEDENLLIFGLPEPSKTWLLAGQNGMSAEEAAEAVKAALRKILLGMGAVRAEHPELPAVLIYHGAVEGATLANGQLLEGGISLGREDLALVGADYIAMGHVHLAQQIPGLPAYYSGSAFPVDWGELDQKGCNLVEIDPSFVGAGSGLYCSTVTRIDFPHAPRKKICVEAIRDASSPGFDYDTDLSACKLDGYDVWLSIEADRETSERIDCDAELVSLVDEYGANPESRVTLQILPTETVRAAEITEQKHLREKVAVYAEASGESVANAKSVLAKADALEAETVGDASFTGTHLRIRKLRLRGATGIWKGLGLDEITLNLDHYDAGLIALVGPNGAGKSTLLENMHPWPCLLTREGKLQDHFRLRDSARELWFVDERDSAEYRALMLIDGVNATGKAEYHLFYSDGDPSVDWQPLTNGRREDYEAAITKLFGSLALFLRSAFVSQRPTKNNPDLAEATKGEKKAIFRELAGLDWLQAAAEQAKDTADQIEAEVSRSEAVTGARIESLQALPDLHAKFDRTVVELEKQQAELDGLEAEGKRLAERAKELAAEKERQAATERAIAEAMATFNTAGIDREKATAEIASLQAALSQRGAAEAELATYDQLREEERHESERAKEHAEQVARVQSEYASALRDHRDHEKTLHAEIEAARKTVADLEVHKARVLSRVDALAGDLAKPIYTCPQCGYVDPELAKQRETKQKDTEALQQDVLDTDIEIEAEKRAIDALQAKATQPPEAPKLPAFDDVPLLTLRGKLLKIDAAKLKGILDRARDAASRIAELEKVEAALQRKAIEAMDHAEDLRGQLDDTLVGRLDKALADLEYARQQYIAANEIRATLRGQADLYRQRIEELEKLQEEIEEAQQLIAKQKAEGAEWRYLERACGVDGIQALELDALGPGIAEVANRLLSAAYGMRFAVEFRTTRIAGRGSKVKQVEDFSIFIHDSEHGSEQELSTLSGGERVWIVRALYDAFSIVRDRNTGLRFMTAFQDEADGALDPEARLAYFAMLRAAHAESGRRNTIIITHSQDAQEMIPQRIVMTELAEVPA